MNIRQTTDINGKVTQLARIVEEKDFPLIKALFRESVGTWATLSKQFNQHFIRGEHGSDFSIHLPLSSVKKIEDQFGTPTRSLPLLSLNVDGTPKFCFHHDLPWFKIEYLIDQLKNICAGGEQDLVESDWAVRYREALGLNRPVPPDTEYFGLSIRES